MLAFALRFHWSCTYLFMLNVTLARSMTDTFAGIRPADTARFVSPTRRCFRRRFTLQVVSTAVPCRVTAQLRVIHVVAFLDAAYSSIK